MINNLGSTTPLEMSILAEALFATGRIDHVIGPAGMMTSLDMHGFSVSVMDAAPDELAALQKPVEVSAWPGIREVVDVKPKPMPDGMEQSNFTPSDDPTMREIISTITESLIASEKQLNSLDAKAGDGDTGSTLATAARALQARLDSLPLTDLPKLLTAIGDELGRSMGGSLGVIAAIYFNASGKSLSQGRALQEALADGLQRVCDGGGANPGDRTMIDALSPALEALRDGLEAAAKAARAGADSTAEMTRARAGRAAYVPEQNLSGSSDPGAEAIAIIFENLARIRK